MFHTKDEAEKFANEKNTAPLEDGKERRNPYRAYFVETTAIGTGYAVGQTPTAALHSVAADLGIKIERVDGETLLPPEEYIKRLSPERLEEVRKLLNG